MEKVKVNKECQESEEEECPESELECYYCFMEHGRCMSSSYAL